MSLHCFVVPGIPAPQGSKTPNRGGFGFHESSRRVKPWRAEVIKATQAHIADSEDFGLIGRAIQVDVHFYFAKPPSSKAEWPVAPTIGDGDKLTRATWDGLVQGGLLKDDRFITRWGGSKQWAGPDEMPGCIVVVKEV